MGATNDGGVKRQKYPYIIAFAKKVKMSRAGAYKALERGDVALCAKYEDFVQAQAIADAQARIEAKNRVSNAVELSKEKAAALLAQYQIEMQ